MNCPTDNTLLQMSERHGVEIDYCPQCRGVWLDRGELDKIIDRVDSPAPMAPPPPAQSAPPIREYHHEERGHHKKHKRESFLSDIFDF